MNVQHRKLQVQVVADLICPWCYIGKCGMDAALPRLAEQGIDVAIEWLPYQLNPALPPEGMNRKAFRTKRFGWETALAMDARAVEAGRRVNATFDYAAQSRTPNTLAAHALVRLARAEGGTTLQSRISGDLFTAYFAKGRDIGDREVLEQIAVEAGMSAGALDRALRLREEVRALDERIKSLGISGVPSHLVDGRLLFSGSQDAADYAERFARAMPRTGEREPVRGRRS